MSYFNDKCSCFLNFDLYALISGHRNSIGLVINNIVNRNALNIYTLTLA